MTLKLCDNKVLINTIKIKRSRRPVLFYSNSCAARQVLLQGDDISLILGPEGKKKTSKCHSCIKSIRINQAKVNCSVCFNMYHLKYSAPDIPQSQYGKAAHIPNKCTCSACSNMILLSELPFYKCRPVSPVYSTPNDQVDLNQSGHSDKHLEIYKSNSKHLSVMHLNTQCMTSTFGALSILINDYHFDIVTLSETWLKDNPLLLQHVSMPGYQLCYNNRDKCRGGGVGAYIKESIKFKRGQDIENLQQEFEHLWLEISGKNKNSKLLLG